MEEYFDIVDENNILTGEKRLRSEAHVQGLWHRTVQIYLYKIVDNEIQILVHLRSKTKDQHPNCWATHFGGHLKIGETIQNAAESELLEEIGLVLEPKNLIQGETNKSDLYPNREFAYTFYHEFRGEISTLKFNDGEVQAIKWMKISDIIDSMTNEPEVWSGDKDGLIQVFDVLKNNLKN